MKPHKWAKEIKAWADGAEIEWRYSDTDFWMPNCNNHPVWHNDEYEFRIKQQPKEPQYLYLYVNNEGAPRFFWNKITPLKTDLIYQGKIKLEVDDE